MAGETPWEGLIDALGALYELNGTDNAAVVLPSRGGKRLVWATCSLFADEAAAEAAAEALPERWGELAKEAVAALDSLAEAEDDEVEFSAARPRVEADGEREVGGKTVRSWVVRVTKPDDGQDCEVLRFDVASAGRGVVAGSLAEEDWERILGDLAAGRTEGRPVGEMGAFREAFGEMPADAAAFCARGMPLVRAVVEGALAWAESIGGQFGGETMPSPSAGVEEFFAAEGLPEVPLAGVTRRDGEAGRVRTTVSVRLADLHALVEAVQRGIAAIPDDDTGWDEDADMGEDDELDEGDDE